MNMKRQVTKQPLHLERGGAYRAAPGRQRRTRRLAAGGRPEVTARAP